MFCFLFFVSSRRRLTKCALGTVVQTCALPISLCQATYHPHCSPRTIRTPADWPRPPRRLEWRCESRTPPCPIRASGPRAGLRRAAPLTCTARSRWRDSLPLLADGEGACVPRNKIGRAHVGTPVTNAHLG